MHMAVDTHGLPPSHSILSVVRSMIAHTHWLCDPGWARLNPLSQTKDYDSQAIRDQIEQQGAKAVIPGEWNSKTGNTDPDRGLYRYRHLVKNIFARLKQCRAVAPCFDKFQKNHESLVAMGLYLPVVTNVKWEQTFG
ncbi:Transposase DDE domain-containing protein [Nitrosomonas eutropha]|nr:Transposase DDE domain-containing protein [Nitrosomonas eutropha]